MTNAMARDTLREIEPEGQRAFGVGMEEIIGGSIHRFHSDPARIEAILRDPSALPRDAVFTFGDTTLETHINRITGPDSELLGYVVSWADVSEKLRMQSDMAKAQSIVENAPSNVMMADLDLTIQYIKKEDWRGVIKASRRFLKRRKNIPLHLRLAAMSNSALASSRSSGDGSWLATPGRPLPVNPAAA